jgi:hypothetical protein
LLIFFRRQKYEKSGYQRQSLFENESGDAFQYYHTVNDDWEHAVFDTYEPLFRLVRDFVEKY